MNRSYLLILLFLIIGSFSCENLIPTEEPIAQKIIIPQETRIVVPSSLNANVNLSDRKAPKGEDIYNYIREYIQFTDIVAEIIENSYQRIAVVENNGILEFPYTGLDGKSKNVSIQENYTDTIANLDWDYYMEIHSETFANLALKAWWNENPLEQKIIFKPSSLNTTKMLDHPDALAEIHYKTGNGSSPYEKSMFIAIKGLTTAKEISYDPNNLVVFVGQSGNTLDISGASNNPNVTLINNSYRNGRNWTFLAKVNTSENISAVQLALPPSSVETVEELFNIYQLKQVILDEIRLVYPGNDLLSESELFNLAGIDGSTFNTPGFFNQQGFISAGDAPSSSYSNLADFEGLVPYIPTFVRDYELTLK